jgi:iron(III) transport system substrate-binding protein
MRMIERKEIDEEAASDDAKLPPWSKPARGLYTFSTDPMVIVYNKALVPERERVSSLAQLAEVVAKDPHDFGGKVTTYDPARHSFAAALQWSYVHARGEEGWKILEKLGTATRSEGSGATMVEKLTTGEYIASFFTSSVSLFSRLEQGNRSKLLEWKFPADGTPVFLRGIAVTKNGKSKASARLFVDFVLSHQGQVAIGRAGLTPYREDVKQEEVPYQTLRSVTASVGEKNLIFVGYDPAMMREQDSFLARWKKAFPG